MNITMIAVGTRGDTQPAIALGKALRQKGHRVTLLAGSNFRDWIMQHGLHVASTSVNLQTLMESEGGKEWVERGHNPIVQIRLMKKLLTEYGWSMVWDAWLACQDADVVISSFTSDICVTAVAEKLNIPQISMPLQPSLIATRDGRSVLNGPLPNRHSIINYWFSKLFIEPTSWQMYGDLLFQLRQELGLPQQDAKANKAVRHNLLTLQAFSAHVVPLPTDWPANVHTTGYWFLDDQSGWQPPPDLGHFLDEGAPPVYIGFGSMTGRNPEKTTEMVLKALQLCGQRAVLLSGWAGLGDHYLPPTVFQLDAAPHSWLFPRMAAVVHHGGAGTTAAGLRAGVPTFIIPHFTDQPYWGMRVYHLGMGPKPVMRHRLTVEKLARGIETAVTSSQIKQNAIQLGALIRAENGVETAVNLIEKQLTS